jgi:hypothetical protein
MLTSVFQLKEKGNEKLHPVHSPRNWKPCLKSKPLTISLTDQGTDGRKEIASLQKLKELMMSNI